MFRAGGVLERTRIGRIKNLNFAVIGRTNWNVIPMRGMNGKFHPNRGKSKYRHCERQRSNPWHKARAELLRRKSSSQ
jgi:hypothetical protein